MPTPTRLRAIAPEFPPPMTGEVFDPDEEDRITLIGDLSWLFYGVWGWR